MCSQYRLESRRADSNRLPLLIASDPSGVAGGCTGLQIPHVSAAFSAPGCCALRRIAFPVMSEWCQKYGYAFRSALFSTDFAPFFATHSDTMVMLTTLQSATQLQEASAAGWPPLFCAP
jgi:hypothetical protein